MGVLLGVLLSVAVAEARNAPKPATPTPAVEIPEVVAEVNGDKIMQSDLAEECLRVHAQEELKDQIKKALVQVECERRQIVVTNQEVNAEIERMAKTFKFSKQEWLNLLLQERNMTEEQYKGDIIWPILAIRKLAGARLSISEEDIRKEYEAQFGPAVQVRQIVLKSRQDAERIRAELMENPDSFSSVAKNHSLDPASQPYGGLLNPIRRHMVNPSIEQVIFALQPGQISPIIEWPAGQFIIYRCEQHLQPQNVDRVKVREQLVLKIHDMKTRVVSEEVFTELQEQARIDVLLGNPARMAQMPGVAAVVNGKNIGVKYLTDVCLKKYGKRVLEDMINKTIIEQACRKQKIVITDADIDAEIREMAVRHLPLRPDGSPNVELWTKLATEQSRLSTEVYRTNTVWPVLALKRLTRNLFQVTEEDIQKSFEANFGEKVRCLAIAFPKDDHRRALEIWNRANKQRTPENFGDLAEQYSSDYESRLARGTIPPIGRHSGQPNLEKEAFGLLPNEISQIVHVDESLVFLYCLGREPAAAVKIEEVRADLIADVFEKKQQIAVANYYELLLSQAAYDNYLTRESKNPQVEKMIRETPTTASGAATPRK